MIYHIRPTRFRYHVQAEDIRACEGCGELTAPFPHSWSRYCSWCWFVIYKREGEQDVVLH